MEIKIIRQGLKLSQRQFSDYFGIPLGTVRNWEQGLASPPEYVLSMIISSLRRNKMINVETIKFMKMLDELAAVSANGIDDFKNATEETFHEKIFYDTSTEDIEGHYDIVLDACVIDDPECYHHDAISYYKDYVDDTYAVKVAFDEDDAPYVQVNFPMTDQEIVIENGKWYFV